MVSGFIGMPQLFQKFQIVPDTYSPLLEADIIANVQGYIHLTILNAISFFYQ